MNLHPYEYSQELHYNQFSLKLDRCVASCNTLNDLSNIICVHVFNMIKRKNESKF